MKAPLFEVTCQSGPEHVVVTYRVVALSLEGAARHIQEAYSELSVRGVTQIGFEPVTITNAIIEAEAQRLQGLVVDQQAKDEGES